jgi:Flp pilus assembly protein TadG
MLKLIGQFAKAKSGLAAVEFAFIAPVMIVMFFGAIELCQAIDCRARVNRVASTASDLVAQTTTVATADMTNIFNAASSILFPYSTSGTQIVVSSLIDNGQGGAKVAWSNAQNATARTAGSTVTVPTGLIVSGSGGSVIFTEVTYTYVPVTTKVLTGNITLRASFYSRPRRSATVTHL